MKNRTMLLMCSLVYLPSVAGTAHAGSIPLRERFLPPSIRLTIACTQAQRSECAEKGYRTCTGSWPPWRGTIWRSVKRFLYRTVTGIVEDDRVSD